MRTSHARLTDLLYRVEQQRRALLAEALPRDLNLVQWIALFNLAQRGPCTMTELAPACAVDRTTLTRTVDTLVLRDLAIRSTPPRDRRTVRVEASPTGRSLAAKIRVQIEALEARWLAAFADEDLGRLVGDLEKLLVSLSPPGKGPAAKP